MNRFIKIANTVIALVMLGALALIYWFAYRPLPQTSGKVPAPLAQGATATRDRLGVPHIRAASLDDALVVQGYVTAQDRLFQMDGLRRLAGGNLAEIAGPAAIDPDRESRQLRMRRIAEAAYISMPAADRALFAAYARGVNFFLETHVGRYPVEFRLLSYEPQPWSAVDSILIGLYMFRNLTTTWKNELIKSGMLIDGDRAKVDFLFPVRGGGELQPGSNAWVVGGAHTASGRPMLSNDMHLEWSIPGIWYMSHLAAPGMNVSGVCLPGVPGVVVGHNDKIAWGLTNLHYDVQDLYIEKFTDNTVRYQFKGQVEQPRVERELIRVRGKEPVQFLNIVTRHGPVVLQDGQQKMALRWSAADPGIFEFPFLDIDRARNWQEFTTALARFPGPGQNFVYADVEGNIGYHAAGKLPIRRNFDGDLPVDGASGDFEWEGYIPFAQLPSAYNPPQGLIVTANQNPFPADYAYRVNGNFAPAYRSRQIRDRLSARNGWKAPEMLSIQTDVYSGFSAYLAKAIVAAYEKRQAHNPDLEEAIGALRGWNGQMDQTEAAPLVITLAYQHLRRALAEVASPKHGVAYELAMAPAVMEKLLRTRPAGWVRDYDELLLKVLAEGVEEGKRIQNANLKKWRYGDYLRLSINHFVGHHLPLVARYFDIGPVPMSGSSTTVKQTSARLGPSMRMTADLGNWDGSWLNIVTGQSGQILSGHYKDEWEHYYRGESYPMQFDKVEAGDLLEFVPGG